MSDPRRHLLIPEEYGRWLGLRWAVNQEAIEHTATPPSVGLTFAMADQVSLFLSGFHSVRAPISFAYTLHLLRLLGLGAISERDAAPGTLARLARAFRKEGRPMRNAGVLCARLCRDVPRLADPPDVADLEDFPRRPWFATPRWMTAKMFGLIDPPELPSLEPEEFDARIRDALNGYTDAELAHWMRFGRGPAEDSAGRIAEEAESLPRDLSEILEGLGSRPRLGDSARLAPQMDGALTFPARERPPSALPTGGYADVSTRGSFDAILPGQLALDDLEFLRRFASHELLYYHREEPASADDEEVVLVIDQGVRTWGDVRVVLSAAAIALARRTARRGTPLRIASTGPATPLVWGGSEAPPADLDPEAIAALIEGSDFTESPAVALADALKTPAASSARDVILLTHPRSLSSADVAEAASAAPRGTRLFAVAVDEAGAVELSELRGGGPVALARCRVTVAPPEPEPVLRKADPAPDSLWKGDIEPIPYPFRLGLQADIWDGPFSFDHAGEYLVALSGESPQLHAWRLDDGTSELLPRPYFDGEIWSDPDMIVAVVGVAGGVVLGVWAGEALCAIHYDLRNRTVVVHPLGQIDYEDFPAGSEWLYDRERHALVLRGAGREDARGIAVDLGARRESAVYRESPKSPPSSARARIAAVAASKLPSAWLGVCDAPAHCHWLRSILFDRAKGAISHCLGAEMRTMTPMSDGQPALRDRAILSARHAGGVLAVLARGRDAEDGTRTIFAFHADTGHVLGTYRPMDGETDFALSADGRRLAFRAGPRFLIAHDLAVGEIKLITQQARGPRVKDVLIVGRMLGLKVGKAARYVHWRAGTLTEVNAGNPIDFRPRRESSGHAGSAPPHGVDRGRFPIWCQSMHFTALLDVLGQVAILDASGRLVAMFAADDSGIAAWTPGGDRLGPASLAGGPPTPGAAEAIGRALVAAEGSPARSSS